MDAAARIEALELQNDRLRERIAQLEAALGMTFVTPLAWGLTPAEARVFGVLLGRSLATKDAIMSALYRDSGKEEAELKIVDVFICKIRRKLRPWAIEILTVWGQGYALSAETKARVREMLALETAA